MERLDRGICKYSNRISERPLFGCEYGMSADNDDIWGQKNLIFVDNIKKRLS